MDLGELVGLMLGAQPLYVDARIVVERSGQPVDGYDVTVVRGTDWVIKRDGGLAHRISPSGTTIERHGRLIESGPPKRLEGEPAAFLLMPRYALIFGRPGEDWRLTSALTVEDDAVTVTLHCVEEDGREGHAVVDRGTGMLRTLVLDDTTWRLVDLRTEPPH